MMQWLQLQRCYSSVTTSQVGCSLWCDAAASCPAQLALLTAKIPVSCLGWGNAPRFLHLLGEIVALIFGRIL